MPHLDFIQEKATKFQYKLSKIGTAIWKLRPNVRKALYLVVVERIVLYVAPIWKSNKVSFCWRLLSLQRGLLLCANKYYNMVSTEV